MASTELEILALEMFAPANFALGNFAPDRTTPVKLQPGKFYAVWINAEQAQLQNFRDRDGLADPSIGPRDDRDEPPRPSARWW